MNNLRDLLAWNIYSVHYEALQAGLELGNLEEVMSLHFLQPLNLKE